MPGKFHHEQIYRGQDLIDKLSRVRVTICGAVRSARTWRTTSSGRASVRCASSITIGSRNTTSRPNCTANRMSAAGRWMCLRNRLFRTAGVEIDAVRKELAGTNARQLLKDCDLIIDTFDNSASRQLTQQSSRALNIACLHVGLNADYGEAIWDERYRVPRDVAGDVRDYALARNLVMMTVAIASEVVLRFVAGGTREDWSITLTDFAARRCE